MEAKVPKYYSLKRDLVKKIEMGDYQEDMPILSERELMETYQVSRITVRRAIDELVNEGYPVSYTHLDVYKRQIHDYTDSVLVADVHKIFQLSGSTISGSRTVETGSLIAPGFVAGILV